jgi:hypothetical protein
VLWEEIGYAELRFASVPHYVRNDDTRQRGKRKGVWAAAKPPPTPPLSHAVPVIPNAVRNLLYFGTQVQ